MRANERQKKLNHKMWEKLKEKQLENFYIKQRIRTFGNVGKR
jgi:hypothetical protein